MTRRLIFDTSPLSHFARAGKLDTLAALTDDAECLVAQAVLGELDRGAAYFPALATVGTLDWLREVRGDHLSELQAFATYAGVLGSGTRHIGEAATLAWAEVNGATAVIDERAATRLGRKRNVDVHGTLWLVANGYRRGTLSEPETVRLVDSLGDSEAWLPCGGEDFFEFARQEGLL